jgi:hypothetical protein
MNVYIDYLAMLYRSRYLALMIQEGDELESADDASTQISGLI